MLTKLEAIIDLYLSEFPYFGDFEILKPTFSKPVSYEDRKAVYKFLVDNGFAIKWNDVKDPDYDYAIYDRFLELTGSGRFLKQCGNFVTYDKAIQTEVDQKILDKKRLYAESVRNKYQFWITVSIGFLLP